MDDLYDVWGVLLPWMIVSDISSMISMHMCDVPLLWMTVLMCVVSYFLG